jgi:hypothetical protein
MILLLRRLSSAINHLLCLAGLLRNGMTRIVSGLLRLLGQI